MTPISYTVSPAPRSVCGCRLRMRSVHHHDHADAVVEGAVHLVVVDARRCVAARRTARSAASCPSSGARPVPSGSTRGMFSSRPPPVMWASALIGWAASARQHVLHVQARRLHDGLRGRACRPVWRAGAPAGRSMHLRTSEKPFECTPLEARPSTTSPGFTPGPGQDLRLLHRADGKTGEVVFACRVHAGHLGGLAADQRATARARSRGRCRRSPPPPFRRRACRRRSSPGRTAARRPAPARRSRSWPPGRCRPCRACSIRRPACSLVPTPSVPLTSTGSL